MSPVTSQQLVCEAKYHASFTSHEWCACGREVLKARWCEPTLSVVDVRIGDEDGSGDSAYRFGPTRFSVIPRSAVGNVSIRFVPDQNADLLIAALRSAIFA